jgi:membrane protein
MAWRGREWLEVARRSLSAWSDDKATLLAAALAYYTLFSIAPLLIIAIAVAGLVFGQEASSNSVFGALEGSLGESGALAVQGMVKSSASRPGGGAVAALSGFAVLLLGAAGVFGQLQEALNLIWKVRARPGGGLLRLLRQRLLSFAMVLVIGFLLLVSLVVSAALSAVGAFMSSRLPGGEALWQVVNFGISIAVVTALFAMIFKILPDVRLRWREVWVGAFVTALLFSLGKLLIGLYLGKSAVGSARQARSWWCSPGSSTPRPSCFLGRNSHGFTRSATIARTSSPRRAPSSSARYPSSGTRPPEASGRSASGMQ